MVVLTNHLDNQRGTITTEPEVWMWALSENTASLSDICSFFIQLVTPLRNSIKVLLHKTMLRLWDKRFLFLTLIAGVMVDSVYSTLFLAQNFWIRRISKRHKCRWPNYLSLFPSPTDLWTEWCPMATRVFQHDACNWFERKDANGFASGQILGQQWKRSSR